MDTRQLEYILAIAEEKNLSKAAEKLFITQSALSQQLAKLKKEGLPPLFVHTKREMQLTDAGKIYVNGARTILRIEQDAMETLKNLSGSRSRTFHISVSPHLQALFLLKALPRLRRAFPQAQIRVHSLEAGKARQSLENGDADLVFFQSLHDSHELFRSAALREEELVIASLPGAGKDSLPLVLPEPGSHLRGICNHALTTSRLQADIYAETNDIPTAVRLVLSGECAAVLPRGRVSDPSLTLRSFPVPCYYYVIAAQRKNVHFPLLDAAIQEMHELL